MSRPLTSAIAVVAGASIASFASAGDCQPIWKSYGLPGTGSVFAFGALDSGNGPVLYAGGGMTGFIVRREGESWVPLPNGPTAEVRALVTHDDGTGKALYAAGEFATAGGVTVNGVGRFDGTNWSSLGSGLGGFTLTLAVLEDPGEATGATLYAGGGFFTTPDGVVLNHVGRWTGSAWEPLGGGVSGPVYAIARFDDGQDGGPAIYAAGAFATAGGGLAQNVARWNGTSWSAVGGGSNGTLRALEVFDDGAGPRLYAAGATSAAGGFVVRRWNGVAWAPVGESLNGTIESLTVMDDGTGTGPALFAGGSFTLINSVPAKPASGVAKLTASGWIPIAAPPGGGVLVVRGSPDGEPALLVGGSFSVMAGLATKSIARWNTCPLVAPIVGDLNGDGAVDGEDLAVMLGTWGVCGRCVADLDGSGVVDGADLALLLGQWTG